MNLPHLRTVRGSGRITVSCLRCATAINVPDGHAGELAVAVFEVRHAGAGRWCQPSRSREPLARQQHNPAGARRAG